MDKVFTVCPYCGVGCGLDILVEDGQAVNIEYNLEHPVNRGALCPKGNAVLEIVYHKDRLRYPLKKEGKEFKRISWDEALDLVSRKLQETKNIYGPDSLGFLSSAKCTNEENYLLQKLARVLGTNNIDHCARLCHAPTLAGLVATFGSGAMTNTIPELSQSSSVFVIGSNFSENHPVVVQWLQEAKDKGAKVIVADPRFTPTAWLADIFLQIRPGTDVALINGMINTIILENLYNQDFIKARTSGFEELKQKITSYRPERVEEITGVPAAKIKEAARIYAKSKASSIVYCMGITQHTSGTDNVISLANLSLICGQIGRVGTGVNPLRGQNNVQGACDMGALATVLPGYVSVNDEEGRKRIANLWGVEYLPEGIGLTVVEMTQAIKEGKVKAMYIMGENPLVADPDTNQVKEALKRLEFLVVEDIFITETAELADLVLPAACFAEREGTFTSTERRVQWSHKSVDPPGEAKPDWEIIINIAKKMGQERYFSFSSPEEILAEINKVVPAYSGITPQRVKKTLGGIHWPCPDTSHPGTPILHREKFKTADGLGKIIFQEYKPAYEQPSSDFPFILTTGRLVIHYNSGAMTRRSKSLIEREPEVYVEINPEDALKLKIKKDEKVLVKTKRGEVVVKAKITKNIGAGVVFMPFHFPQTNILTIDALDLRSKIPEFKVAACQIEKMGGNQDV